MLREALFYKKHDDKIKCFLCPHNCNIPEGKHGLCGVRVNKEEILKTINYGEITSMAIDPIEKKPLYHFKPGGNILSVGSFGCNFSCDFCQNYSISKYKPDSKYILPEELIPICSSASDSIGIAFTYNEPSIWYEYVLDTSRQLKEKHPDLNVVLVTNGFIEEGPLVKLLPYIDAMNIDLKSFQNDYYRKTCGGEKDAVLKTIENSYKACHVEITTLLVNGLNDSEEEIKEIASYLAGLNKDIPLHLTRYFPSYKMEAPPTDIKTMLKAREIAAEYLNYVYLGNIPNTSASTYCPQCKTLLVERSGYYTKTFLEEERCPECDYEINIVL
ncbi:pyruvate formate lyase activating enzyme [Proteiniborus sp. DW1]|uniref:AmmeMemoRadiSam system radical SAM enzyme n=1 Tax=Proteiniborus sp. DW1 TaxID=1889883 RepID=UPI00092E0F46|nr:AmmeMemoRadiSam system radical SAM enzyme [Proteiniborus sp. DW1]SCG81948.1 pyruvate formate lyase activating enzyme [Proteiniborus sp. DW1]